MSEVALTEKPKLIQVFADRYSVDADKVMTALKSTAFKQSGNSQISNEQMMALMIVANEYKLNPFTKEIFAYPDKGSIVPVVSVDGWNRIINSNPAMDGIEFEYSESTLEHKGKTCHEWIDCLIYRKDRSRPIKVREFFSEVVRDANYKSPWDTHPNRMHRHKAEIQCARIAFGFAGIYDQDEAERIMESGINPSSPEIEAPTNAKKEYFDSLIEHSNATGMAAFRSSIDEAEFFELYNSFEKGAKVKYKAIVDELTTNGLDKLKSTAEAINEASAQSDDIGVNENLEGWTEDEMALISTFLSDEAVSFMRSIGGE